MFPLTASDAISERTERCGLVLANLSGFLLAFRGCITYLFFRSNPQSGAGATVALTLSWLLLLIGYTVVDPPMRTSSSSPNAAPRWVLAYLGLAAASLAWTTTNGVAVAAAYWAAT